MAQQTAVEYFAEQSKKILIDFNKNRIHFRLNLCLHELNDLEQQAKEMEKQQREDDYKRGWQESTSISYKYQDRRSIN
jgi:hypothetical protein